MSASVDRLTELIANAMREWLAIEDPDVLLPAYAHVEFPPHTFRECPDGSVEVRASIALYAGETRHEWHGFLDEGHEWRDA